MERAAMKPKLDVHLYVTAACNLACLHCYYDAVKGRPSVDGMATADIVGIVTALCARYDADIHMEGGELFLRDDIGAVLAALPAECLPHLTLTTNGTVPIGVDRTLLARLGAFRISFEGHTAALHGRLRNAGFERVFSTATDLMAQGVPVVARVSLWPGNAPIIAEMGEVFDRAGFARVALYPLQAVGRGIALDNTFLAGESDVALALDGLASYRPMRAVVSLNLPARFEPLLAARRARLEAAGHEVRALRPTPTLTINHDGSVGVSPWRATAAALSDRIGDLTADAERLAGLVERGTQVPRGEHDSTSMVVARPGAR
jgi:MoaA/NifB/PqqE/SkfB family radical SAM enzyme